jgi:hypothetical protein
MKIDNLAVGSWALVLFEGYKTHFCPSELVGDLIADIGARGGNAYELQETDTGGADLPGIVAADRHWEDILVDGFKLGFPSQDFEYFMAELGSSPVRKFANGREYHKIHGWLHCIVLTPEQQAFVLKAMVEMLPEVRQRAEEENKRFLEAIDRANKDRLRVVSWREQALRGTVPPKDRN